MDLNFKSSRSGGINFFLNFGELGLSYFLHAKQFLAQMVKNLPAMPKTRVQFLGWEDSLQKEMETHTSLLVWRIPWTEEPGGLQSMGSQSQKRLHDKHFKQNGTSQNIKKHIKHLNKNT